MGRAPRALPEGHVAFIFDQDVGSVPDELVDEIKDAILDVLDRFDGGYTLTVSTLSDHERRRIRSDAELLNSQFKYEH